METRRFDKKDVKEVAELLKNGKVVAFPTDTVFGLGVIYENEEALRKLKESKGRPESHHGCGCGADEVYRTNASRSCGTGGCLYARSIHYDLEKTGEAAGLCDERISYRGNPDAG